MSSFIIFAVVIIVGMIVKAANQKKASQGGARTPGTPSPAVQKLIQRIQAKQGGNMPIQYRGQIIQPPSGPPMPGQTINSAGQVIRPAGPVQDPGRAQASAQLSGMLQQLMRTGQNAGPFGQQVTGPGQQYAGPQTGYAPPGQFQPPQPPPWVPTYQSAPAGRPPQNKGDLDTRIRALMSTGHEVAAVRLLSEEKDLGIIDAQKYARSLVAGPDQSRSTTAPARPDSPASDKPDEDSRYVGSAAFSESLFSRDDDDVWASGWVDKPEVEDRTDIDELWETVQNAGRPKPQPS